MDTATQSTVNFMATVLNLWAAAKIHRHQRHATETPMQYGCTIARWIALPASMKYHLLNDCVWTFRDCKLEINIFLTKYSYFNNSTSLLKKDSLVFSHIDTVFPDMFYCGAQQNSFKILTRFNCLHIYCTLNVSCCALKTNGPFTGKCCLYIFMS